MRAGYNRVAEVPRDQGDIELEGVYAEFAVARYFDVEPVAWVYKGRGGPEDDLVSPDGWTLSIKSTATWVRPHLILRPKDVNCDRYVLVSVILSSGSCWLRGWLPRVRLFDYRPAPFMPGTRPSRNIPAEELIDFSEWGAH